MTKNFIISGSGGQGIVSIGAILAAVFMNEGKFVTFSSSYGAEMRGGAVNCKITMSDSEIYCVNNTFADYVVSLSQESFNKFQDSVKEQGIIIVDSSLINPNKKRDDIKYITLPITKMAQDLGNIKFANSIALGVLLQSTGDFAQNSLESVEKAFNYVLKSKKDLVQKNIEATKLGFNCKIEVNND